MPSLSYNEVIKDDGFIYDFPEHVACNNRSAGNSNLRLYFSKDPAGNYILSINGPVSKKYKNKMAKEMNQLLRKFSHDE